MNTLAYKLIQEAKTLVLATADPDPWTAPVYYLHRNGRFYFFSNPDSRHVKAALGLGSCAGAIFRESADWRQIEGLQMGGTLAVVSPGMEAHDALEAYIDKFPTVREFFPDQAIDLEPFTARFRSRLYAFEPAQVYYLNNQAGLGKRQLIELDRAD